ncbi:MAG TPA: hypothetical protein PLR25_17435 [Planctomycetaceae bacterium]|nr:hypothetical protein [Planctomycetaceae bacterium]
MAITDSSHSGIAGFTIKRLEDNAHAAAADHSCSLNESRSTMKSQQATMFFLEELNRRVGFFYVEHSFPLSLKAHIQPSVYCPLQHA